MHYHQAKFDIYHIEGVRENCFVKVFATFEHSAGPTLIITKTFSCKSKNGIRWTVTHRLSHPYFAVITRILPAPISYG